MEHICEYCNKSFSKRFNLHKHQTTSKYCQEIQKVALAKKEDLTCQFCNRECSRSDSLHRHYTTCIEYQIHLRVSLLQAEIKNLQQCIAEKDRQLAIKESKIDVLTAKAIDKPTTINVNVGVDKPIEYPSSQREMSDKVTELVDILSDLVKPLTHTNLRSIPFDA